MGNKKQPKIEIYTLEWCPYCSKAKMFLKSKGLAYEEYLIDKSDANKEEMKRRTDGAKTVPQIFIDDQLIGGYDDLIAKKNDGELYELLNIEPKDNFSKNWDLLIAGAGPAGLNAALYGARKGLDILILSESLGGQMADTGKVDNYLGIPEIEGPELLHSFWNHVEKYEVGVELGEKIRNVNKIYDKDFLIETDSGNKVKSKTLLVATGTSNRELGVEGEKKYKGKGVHYCATCDGYLYSGQHVAIIGGGNAGMEAALDLADIGCEIDLIEVEEKLTGDKILQDKVQTKSEINLHLNTDVKEFKGNDKLEQVILNDLKEEKKRGLKVDGVFVEIGLLPNSDFVKDQVEVNEIGEIIVDENNETSVKGIWAAGDVTEIKDKQIITAAAEGAKAALRVNEYLK